MELYPSPDFKAIEAKKRQVEAERRRKLFIRIGEFLSLDSGGDENHPAALAKKALETGSTDEFIAYLKEEIDKAESERNEVRRGDLMRWKASLN